ncbi:MAG: GGDEF domain-containing protein [Thermaceae bacterium]|nr:GGDEF domain-containing protein [Thermaceae bacterium]
MIAAACHSTAPEEQSPLYRFKRMVLWVSLPLGIVAALVGWVANGFGQGGGLYDRLSLPVFALSLTVCLLLLSCGGRNGLRRAEVGVFWSTALLMLLNLYFNLLVVAKEGVWLTAVWMGLVFLLAHYVYEPGMALRVSAGLFVALLIVGGAALWPQVVAGAWSDPNVVVQIYGSQLIYLLLTRFLVAYREQADRLRLQAEALHHLAYTDSLTGLANRRSVREALAAELARASSQGPLALILLDLDRFKQINDRYGHEVGDRVLVHVAGLLQTHSRRGDLVGRWGGEEFVLLLPGGSLAEAQGLAERLQAVLSQNPLEGRYSLSASFGVAIAHAHDTPDSLISRADNAMYASKEAGGNRVEVAIAG